MVDLSTREESAAWSKSDSERSRTHCVIPSRPTSSKAGQTCELCKNCWVTLNLQPRRFTLPSLAGISKRLTKEATRVLERAEHELQDLWKEYKGNADPAARDGLILHYSALVKFVAGRLKAGLPRSVDPQDLVSYGTFGLIDAIDKFEPERGYKFETYAVNRIKGAILDELRALDWVPRSVRARAREIQRSLGELEHRLQRSPTDEELAEHMNMETEVLQDRLGEIATLGIMALDDLLNPGERDSSTMGDLLADPAAADPSGSFEQEETRYLLVDAVNRLSDRERLVVTLYYYEGLTLAEIGRVLTVTESRVCQIHTKAVMSLRNRLMEPPSRRA